MTDPNSRPPAPYGDFQLEIYLAGLSGTVPSLPVSFAELESRAAQALPPFILSYVAGGAGDEHTQRANVAAFGQWGLMPRMLVGATKRDLSVVRRVSFIALLVLLLAGIVLIFVHIPHASLIYAVLGLVIFAGLTAADFQRLRRSQGLDSAPLLAASIFLDILNVFWFFLRIFSGSRD